MTQIKYFYRRKIKKVIHSEKTSLISLLKQKDKDLKYTKTITSFIGIVIIVSSIVYVFLCNFAPLGIHTKYTYSETHKEISELGPKKRIKIETQNKEKIYKQTDDLIYFTTKMPFKYDQANFKIFFKNTDQNQTISAGFRDKKQWHYNTKVIHAPFIDAINWNHFDKNPTIYQRTPIFNSIDALTENPPSDALIGLFDSEDIMRKKEVWLSGYAPQKEMTTIDTPLRGKHTLYAYLDKEPFILKIQKQDLNWYEDPDVMVVSILKGNQLVYKLLIDDDGVSDASHKVKEPQEAIIKNPGPELPESGVYKVVIDASADTTIKKLETNLHKIVFNNTIFPISNSQVYPNIVETTSPTTVYTNALTLSPLIYHNAAKQNIFVDDQTSGLYTLNSTSYLIPKGGISKVVLPKSDAALNGFMGYFSFSPEQFFIPTNYHMLPITKKDDIEIVDYIITDYLPTSKIGEWQVAEKNYDLSDAFIKDGKLSWIIKSPGLKANNRSIIIKDIEITLKKEPWSMFKGVDNNAISN